MAPTGADLVAAARKRLDWDYKNDAHRLIGDTRTTDCSGFVFLAAQDLGLAISTDSSSQARDCRNAGTDGIPITEALGIEGALLFKGKDGGLGGIGDEGHVAISMGDGVNVIEAKSTKSGVLIDPALGGIGHAWTNAGLLPGLDYPGLSVRSAARAVGRPDDEEIFMIVQPNKDPSIPNRVCMAKLNVDARVVELFNGAAIAFDGETQDEHVRRWKIGARAADHNPTIAGTPVGMAALPDGSGIVVMMSDHGTFIGKWT